MNSNIQFKNENLKGRTVYIVWLATFIFSNFGLQFLKAIVKDKPISATEWVLTICIAVIVTIYYSLHKRLKNITYDRQSSKIIIITTSLVKTKATEYNFADINFKLGKDPATLRRNESKFIEIFSKKKKIIKLERENIGHHPFDNLVKEFQIPNVTSE